MPAYEVITGPSPWPARYTFSPAVRAGNLLFISGMTAGDETGQIVGPGYIVAQTRYIFEKFGRLLAAAGAGFEHIVQTTEYVTTTRELRQDRGGAPRDFQGPLPHRHRRDRRRPPARGRPDRNLRHRGCTRSRPIPASPSPPGEKAG